MWLDPVLRASSHAEVPLIEVLQLPLLERVQWMRRQRPQSRKLHRRHPEGQRQQAGLVHAMLVVAIAEPKVVLCLEGADARDTYIVVYRCRPCPWCPLQEPIFSTMHNDAMDIVVARAANSPVGEGADPA
jgi:hypothetical protein